MESKNYGILTSLDWNSNLWQKEPTQDDIEKSNFGYVEEHGITFTCINFGHEIYPTDTDGLYSAVMPQFWSKTLDKEKSKYVSIVFCKSYNWHDKQNYIIGFYAFPVFIKGEKISPLEKFKFPIEYNIKSLPH